MPQTGQTGWRAVLHRAVHFLSLPADTRVDPSLFPEDEFPVYCPSCDYLLRGLSDSRCPECGTPFDRGRLLVAQYVVEQGRRQWPQVSKWARWTLTLSYALAIGWLGGMLFIGFSAASGTNTRGVQVLDWLFDKAGLRTLGLSPAVVLVILPATLCVILAAMSYGLRTQWNRHRNEKCKRVQDQIDKNAPSYIRYMQRNNRLCLAGLIVAAPGMAWSILDEFADVQFLKNPTFLALVFGIAVGAATLVLVGPPLWRWIRKS